MLSNLLGVVQPNARPHCRQGLFALRSLEQYQGLGHSYLPEDAEVQGTVVVGRGGIDYVYMRNRRVYHGGSCWTRTWRFAQPQNINVRDLK